MRFEDVYAELGGVIKAAREAAGLTQDELAKLINLSRASIANIETGRQKVFLHQLYMLAHHLDVPVIDLLPKQSSFGSCLPSDLSDEQKFWAESVLASFAGPEQTMQSALNDSDLNTDEKEWAASILRSANG